VHSLLRLHAPSAQRHRLSSDSSTPLLGRICWVLCSAVGIARRTCAEPALSTVLKIADGRLGAMPCDGWGRFRAMSGMRRSHDISRRPLSPALSRICGSHGSAVVLHSLLVLDSHLLHSTAPLSSSLDSNPAAQSAQTPLQYS
jgi:hypothetical protein